MTKLQIAYFLANEPKPTIEPTNMLVYIDEQRESTVWTGTPMVGAPSGAVKMMPGYDIYVCIPWHPELSVDKLIRNIIEVAEVKEIISATVLMPKHIDELGQIDAVSVIQGRDIEPAVASIRQSRLSKIILGFADRGRIAEAFERVNALQTA